MPHDDAHDAQEREKWRAYPDTVLHFSGPPVVRVDLREPVDARTVSALASLGLTGAFAIFTAENPEGEHVEDEDSGRDRDRRARENAARTDALFTALDEAGAFHVPVEGSAPDGSYPERCVAVALERDEAVALAERLGQLALFWFDGRRFWLLPAEAEQAPVSLPPG